MDTYEYDLLRSAGQPKVSEFPEVDENMYIEGGFITLINQKVG